MRPESTSVTFRPDLSALAQEYDIMAAEGRFVAKKVAPLFASAECSGGFPIMNRENFKKAAANKRAEGGRYNRITGEFGKGTFDCEDYGLEYPIDDRRRRRYARLFDAEDAATKMVRFQQLINHEIRVASLISGAGFTNHNVTTAWTTVATAVPLDDIQTGIDALTDNCGTPGSEMTLIIPRTDFRELMKVTQVVNKMQYTYPGIQPGQLQPAQVAGMLGIKQVLVTQSAKDSTEEGYAESVAQIWTAAVMYVCVVAEENDPLEIPSVARTILWTGDSPELPVIETYREEETRSDIVRAREDSDEVLMGATDLFAYKLTNT